MDASSVIPLALVAAAGSFLAKPLFRTGRSLAIEHTAGEFENAALGLYACLGTDDWDGETVFRSRLNMLQLDLQRRGKTDKSFVDNVHAAIAKRGRVTQQHLSTLQPLMMK